MASFMGRRRAENWKSLFSGVWRAEHRREVTVDNELRLVEHWHSEALLTITKGVALRKVFVPSSDKEGFYCCKCNNKTTTI